MRYQSSGVNRFLRQQGLPVNELSWCSFVKKMHKEDAQLAGYFCSH